MTVDDRFLDIELSALMCSRVCHDVISPVGAITNGLEVLEEDPDDDMRAIANDLIRNSARQASAKLQFARLAFGAAGSAGAAIDFGDAEDAVRGLLEGDKVELDWQLMREPRPKNEVKLLLNLILIGRSAIPRGGRMTVTREDQTLKVVCSGTGAALPDHAGELQAGALDVEQFDARSIQLYLAHRLAAASGITLEINAEGETVSIAATHAASKAA